MATTGAGEPFVLTATPQIVLTAAANELVIVTRFQAYNSDTTARIVTLYQVPDGDTPDAATNLVHKQTVYAGQSTSIDFSGAIAADGAIYAECDVTDVVIFSSNYFKSDQLV